VSRATDPDAARGPRVIHLGDQVGTVLSAGTPTHDVAIVDTLLPPGAGAPVHRHHDHEEAFYVVSGTVEVEVDGQRSVTGTGGFILATRGVAHGFRNVGEGDARLLAMYAPASALAYLDDLAAVLAGGGGADAMAAFYARHASGPA
jgi:quercetin dioxygenase-like cupin family protein